MSMYQHVTFLLCLPRSRSAWLAELMRPFASVMHCPLLDCASVDELKEKIDKLPPGRVFVADIASLQFFEQIVVKFPGAQFITVHRPALDVIMSIRKLNIQPNAEGLYRMENKLRELAQAATARTGWACATYFQLHSPDVIAALFAFVTDRNIDWTHYNKLRNRKVEYTVEQLTNRTNYAKQRLLMASLPRQT